MTAPEGVDTSAAQPLDAERARLRAAGFTDDEISRIFVGRELGAAQQQAGAGASAGAQGQGVMSGVLSNMSAVWAHVRGIIPAIASQVLIVGSSSAAASARLAAFLSLVVKAAFICVFAYVVSLEFSQLRAATGRSRVETCQARQQSLVMNKPLFGESAVAAMKAAREHDQQAFGLPPPTPEELEREKRQDQERQARNKRFEELYAQWRKDCADVVP